MPQTILFILMALLSGVAIATQTGVNTQLRTSVGHPLSASLISFCVGTAFLAAIVAALRAPLLTPKLGQMPWWMWTGGILGVFIVSTNIIVAPRLGAALLMSLAIAGQLGAGLIMDHYGAFGFPVHPISLGRIAGALLLVAGVALIRWM